MGDTTIPGEVWRGKTESGRLVVVAYMAPAGERLIKAHVLVRRQGEWCPVAWNSPEGAAAFCAWGDELHLRREVAALCEALAPEALVLVAALLRLGPPGGAVAAMPARVRRERGDTPDTYATRAETGPRERAAEAWDHAARAAAAMLAAQDGAGAKR